MSLLRALHPIGQVDFLRRLVDIKSGRAGRDENTIPVEHRTLASLAKVAYESPSRQTRKRKLDEILPDENTDEWTYERKFSDLRTSVFSNQTTGQIFTSFRGTDVGDAQDLATDVAVLLNRESETKRFRTAERKMSRILDSFPDQQHILTGHSLGGTVNLHLKQKFGDRIDEVHNFNPGSNLKSVLNDVFDTFTNQKDKSVFTYHVVGDPISIASQVAPTENNFVYDLKKGTINPHSIDQFLS